MTHTLIVGLEDLVADLEAHNIVQKAPYLEAWLLNNTALSVHLTREEREQNQARYDALFPLDRPAQTPELTPDEPVTTEPTPAEVAEPEPTPAEPAEPVTSEPTTNP